jgi:hypothetical protein
MPTENVAVESKHEQPTAKLYTVPVIADATEMVAVVVTIQQQVPMEATFKVTVPRKDAENHDLLLKACDEQEQEQDAFGYYEPQAGEWHYDGELHSAYIDVLSAEVIYSEITGVVEPE